MTKKEFPIAPVLEEGDGKIVLFRPNIPIGAAKAVTEVLSGRWIGQGPRVEKFEKRFQELFSDQVATAISCGSGTDALHLAYLLAGVRKNDEVICTVFTCTASNLPALYIGAKVVFADIDPFTMNISVEDVRQKITNKTKAIVFVDYGGVPANLTELKNISKEFGIPLIEDAAHALGATYDSKPIGSISDYTIFSFQAIKHITTGDGGMLMIKDSSKVEEAKRLRWFGIDRTAKFTGIWENDITEVGYKYQMNDISAAIGLCALDEFPSKLQLRRELLNKYITELKTIPEVQQIGINNPGEHAAWLHTICVQEPQKLQSYLFTVGIETGQVHFRNDRYTIFGGRRIDLPNMDEIETKYLVLPLHTYMNVGDVERVCSEIRNFYNSKF